jgi:hypothetical protein
MSPEWMPVINTVIAGVFSVLGIVITILCNKYIKDAQMRSVLEAALQNGLGVLQQAAKDGVQLEADPKVEAQLPPTTSPQMTAAVQYVVDHADEAVKRFDIAPTMIAQKLVARAGVQDLPNALSAPEVRTLMAVRRHKG